MLFITFLLTKSLKKLIYYTLLEGDILLNIASFYHIAIARMPSERTFKRKLTRIIILIQSLFDIFLGEFVFV